LGEPEIVGISPDLGNNAGALIDQFRQVGAAADFGFDVFDDVALLAETDVGGDAPLGRVGVLIRGLALHHGIEDGDVFPAHGDLVGGLDTAGDDEIGIALAFAVSFGVGMVFYSWILL